MAPHRVARTFPRRDTGMGLGLVLLLLLGAGAGAAAGGARRWEGRNGTVVVRTVNATRTQLWLQIEDRCKPADCPPHYAVTYRESGTNGSWTSMVGPGLGAGSETTVVLSALRSGVSYDVRVRTAKLNTSTCPATPEPVREGEVDSVESDHAVISWLPPALDCQGKDVIVRWAKDWDVLDSLPKCENVNASELHRPDDLWCEDRAERQCFKMAGLSPGHGYPVHIYVRDHEGQCSERHYVYVRTPIVRLGGLGVGGWTALVLALLALGGGVAYAVSYVRKRRMR